MNNDKKNTSERDSSTISVWQEGLERPAANPGQPADQTIYDVLIVGAGLTGITTALMLQHAGKQCILIEGNTIGYGTTGGTSAHLNTFFDATYPEIDQDFGTDASRLVAEGGKEAFSLISAFVNKYNIDCDLEYKDAYLFSENEKESKQLADILKASKNAGIAVDEANENGVPISFDQAILFKDQGQFHPLKYGYALVEAFKSAGGKVLENTFIDKATYEDDVHTVWSGDTLLKGKNLIYATHIPPGINILSLRCAPYRSYVLGIKLKDEAYPDALSYDMQEPYHYFRSHVIEGQRYLILGGEDHKTGHDDPEMAFNNLEAYARKHFKVDAVTYKWSAQYYVPADGLPYIGIHPQGNEHTFIATGFNGNGMMFGTLSAKIICDLILGNESKYAKLFSPSRIKPIAGFMDFVKENADVAYHFVADRFSAKEIESLTEIKAGEGQIIEYKDQKLAVYKDSSGKISALDPVCTHAGCIVKFNTSEKSWDCPCHGGRFSIDGKVLNGPPTQDLKAYDLTTLK
ncbi:FAD-dependent oxidoreductase [Pedobacter metabolipauper]|uniref:Glycine/D-amino acid oxidase-like deaminating enzyme n=1 Tax=Pedobacter metabolipauper TaxID=425513 RepID=A0A4R6T0M9_9SPHI|nr:FAD-dependent oxidoreductase [Pedobacter metabolipauper]TDQ11937.1 glycine/D-amino acid oxidase-like deaminating enzyme [Pedobacter metabolipauper]